MTSIVPFKIAIPDEKLKRLKQKLSLTDFPDEVDTADPWARGSPLADIKRLALFWEKEYDWRTAEDHFNTLLQFVAKIEVQDFGAYDVHFLHHTSEVKNAIPLLFVHGWPSSCFEITKMLPELVQGGVDFPAFHVVAPSLIDFGFSSASKKSCFGVEQHAEACHQLMQKLGYDEYVVQGGDIGYTVARFLAIKYGKNHCKAHHISNAAPAQPTEGTFPELYAKVQATSLSESEMAGLARSGWFNSEGNGYYRQQSTKPQTIGYSMSDSPIGLLAWIYEKLHDWTDNYPWTDEEILTWTSIYYFSTPGPAASQKIFYENEHRDPSVFPACQVYVDVPLGISRFPKDLILLPKLWNHTMGPVVFEREHENGGHFGVWECPNAIVSDLRAMFEKIGGAYNCVSGRNGYLQ